jgi:hypothetical protein
LATTFAGGAEMDVKYQVFVSSTFVDLEVERRQVIEAILNLGHIPVGMEAFQASDDTQWDYIKRRISECDYYIVIVGERYGSEYQGKSYTQMEYEFAVEASLPVAAFLMSQTARDTLSRTKVEFAKAEQIEAFRVLCQQKLCKHWDNGSDLAGKVILALTELTREKPRTGWVRPAKLAPEDVLKEMAILLEKNRELQAIADRLQAVVDGLNESATLRIPPDAAMRIEDLAARRMKDIMFRDENFQGHYTLLDIFLGSVKMLAKGCDHFDFGELLRSDYETFGEDDEITPEIMGVFSLNKLINIGTKRMGNSPIPAYTLSEYGKDFVLYAQIWQQSLPDPTFMQRSAT